MEQIFFSLAETPVFYLKSEVQVYNLPSIKKKIEKKKMTNYMGWVIVIYHKPYIQKYLNTVLSDWKVKILMNEKTLQILYTVGWYNGTIYTKGMIVWVIDIFTPQENVWNVLQINTKEA